MSAVIEGTAGQAGGAGLRPQPEQERLQASLAWFRAALRRAPDALLHGGAGWRVALRGVAVTAARAIEEIERRPTCDPSLKLRLKTALLLLLVAQSADWGGRSKPPPANTSVGKAEEVLSRLEMELSRSEEGSWTA
jgi:hypothetical protein